MSKLNLDSLIDDLFASVYDQMLKHDISYERALSELAMYDLADAFEDWWKEGEG